MSPAGFAVIIYLTLLAIVLGVYAYILGLGAAHDRGQS